MSASAGSRLPQHQKPDLIGWVKVFQWQLKLSQSGPSGKWPQKRVNISDSPLVVRLPKGKTGEGLVFSSSPAEGVLSFLVGEPWTRVVKVAYYLRVQKPYCSMPFELPVVKHLFSEFSPPRGISLLAPFFPGNGDCLNY